MLLVLLGTQKMPFNRLIQELCQMYDEKLLPDTDIVIQSGVTQVPDTYPFLVVPFLTQDEYHAYIQQADYIITHGGAGSIFDALAAHKKVIGLARLKQYHEHVDDHQLELIEKLYQENYIIGESSLQLSFQQLTQFPFVPYQNNTEAIIDKIRKWIE